MTESSLTSFITGIYQGIIEFFPVSSTGHLILWQLLNQNMHEGMGLKNIALDAIVQLGSGIALFIFFLLRFINNHNPLIRSVGWKKMALLITVASFPAGLSGVLFHSYIKTYLYSPVIIAWALLIGGILFILVDTPHNDSSRKRGDSTQLEKSITLSQALFIGIAQAIALIPGVSRSGATILAGSILGLKRETAISFSFLMATPILIGAGSYDLLKQVVHPSRHIEMEPLVLGFIGAFAATLMFAKMLLLLLEKVGLAPFGWYRIALGGSMLLYFHLCLSK